MRLLVIFAFLGTALACACTATEGAPSSTSVTEFCLSQEQDGMDALLLRDARAVAQQVVHQQAFYLRDFSSNRFRVARRAPSCVVGETALTGAEIQQLINVAVAGWQGPTGELCTVRIPALSTSEMGDLYQRVGASGVRLSAITMEGDHGSVRSWDSCPTTEAVVRELLKYSSM
jgi:hypothetical protein